MKHVLPFTHIHLLLAFCSILISAFSFSVSPLSLSQMDGGREGGVDGWGQMIIFSEIFNSNVHTVWTFL